MSAVWPYSFAAQSIMHESQMKKKTKTESNVPSQLQIQKRAETISVNIIIFDTEHQ